MVRTSGPGLHIAGELAANPLIRRAQPLGEHSRGRPVKLLADEPIIGIPAADSSWAIDVAPHYRFTCDSPDNVDELVNRHHFLRTDVNGLRQL
jgi:hypothetical protein